MPVGPLMLGFLDGFGSAVKLAIGAALGLLVGWAATFAFVSVSTIPAAREAARNEERLVWQERQARAAAKAEADRASAQAAIDAVERDYHQREAIRANDMAALEAALAEERDHAPVPTPSPGGACACRPAIARSVSDRLNRLGRAAAGAYPAEPHARVP